MLREMFDPGDWLGMKPALDPSASPLSLDYAPASAEVKLRIGLGLFVLTAVAILIFLVLEDGFAIFVACGFGFFGLINLVYGVVQSGFEKSLLVTDTTVFVKTRSLFLGRREWREPIANYRGVLMREGHIRRGTIGNIESTKTYHIVELAHDDARRTTPLHVREEGAPPRDIQEAFARRLGLPALAPDRSGEATRPVGGLDRPLARREASLQDAPAMDPGPPPSGVRVKEGPDAIRITVGQGRTGRVLTWMFWCAVPLVFGGIVFALDPVMGVLAAGMASLFVLMILGLGRLMNGKAGETGRAINIGADRIWIDQPSPEPPALARGIISLMNRTMGIARMEAGPAAARSLPREAVEQVRVDTYTSYTSRSGSPGGGGPTVHARLVIEGDEGRLTFVSTQFDGGKLEWVRDYLRFVLARDARPGDDGR